MQVVAVCETCKILILELTSNLPDNVMMEGWYFGLCPLAKKNHRFNIQHELSALIAEKRGVQDGGEE